MSRIQVWYRLSLSNTLEVFLEFRPDGLSSWEKSLCELNMLAVYDQISDHSDISKLQMRLCLSRSISVYIPFQVLRRTLAIPHNIILCCFSRDSRNIFGPPQNCLDFPESSFGCLTKFKFFLFSFGSFKNFKQVAEPEQI